VPRRCRFEIPGIPQHVVQRGNNRSLIFSDDEDRLHYLDLAAQRARKRNVSVHAYVLMGNHVHLLVSASEIGAISRFMHDLNSMYVSGFNERHGRTGTLWEGRFRSSLVDNKEYLWNCHRYIEFNPVRANLVLHPGQFRWSSYAANALGHMDALVTPARNTRCWEIPGRSGVQRTGASSCSRRIVRRLRRSGCGARPLWGRSSSTPRWQA
jgi:putative transposase